MLISPVVLALALAAQPAPVAEPGPAAAPRLNPTKRTLRFIVPVTDGPTYLGDVTLAIATDDRLSVQADRLLQMLEPILKPDIFARLKTVAGSQAEIGAEQLAVEKIGLSYDSEKLALAIAIPPLARRQSALSLRDAASAGVPTLAPAGFSAFMNFRSAVDLVERGSDTGIVPPVSVIDGAVRALGVVAEGEGYFSLRKDEPRLRRTGSRLIFDDLHDVIRFTAGDLSPFGRSFQSTPTVAGLSASRFYYVLEPWREFRSTGSQSFTLVGQSTVETIVNGRTVERKLLQPGSYTLNDFPLAEGANDVRLQIEDESGKRRTVEFNLYSNRELLEPGATEFSAFGGVYSQPTRTGIHYSRDWASSGFIRRGIGQQLTAGANFQADARAQQAGVELLLGTGLGLVGFDLAGSRRRTGAEGFAAIASVEKIIQSQTATRSLSLRASAEVRSASFAVPGSLLEREPLAFRGALGGSVSLARDTFIAADAQYSRDRVDRISIYSARVSGGTALSETLALVGEAQWDKSRSENGGLVRIGLRKRLGLRGTAQVDIDSRGVARASYQNSSGVGVGSWSGSIDVNRTPDATSLNANGTLITNRAELGLSQFGSYAQGSRAITDVRTSLRAGTSIGFAGGSFAIGRPIQQAFLIAQPHRTLGDKPVLIDPQDKSEQARSGALGGALDGALTAYSPRTLIYNVPDAPAGYDLGAGNVQLVPPYKAGYRLEVGSDYHLLVIGRLLDARGEPISLLAGKAIDLRAPKRPPVTMFTSRGGKFAAQGLRSGRWRIEMPTEDAPTIFEIDIRDDPSGTVRLGDVRPLSKGSDK